MGANLMPLQSIKAELVTIRREIREIKELLIKTQQRWVTEKEAAKEIGMSVGHMRRLRRQSKIPADCFRVRSSGRGLQYDLEKLNRLYL